MTGRRYPLAQLLAVARMTRDDLVRKLGVRGVNVKLVTEAERAGGLLTEIGAERASVACGFVPYVVWPEWIDDVIADVSRPCERCRRPFVPKRRTSRFCSSACADSDRLRRKRERYRRDASYRHRKQQAARARYERSRTDPELAARLRAQRRAAQRRYRARQRQRGVA